jgi:hypothetical protein
MATFNLNNKNDNLIEINKDNFTSKSPFSFNIPSKKINKLSNNDNSLFNRKKVSNEVLSSRGSSRASSVSSVSSASTESSDNRNKKKKNKSRAPPSEVSESSEYTEESSDVSDHKNSKHKKNRDRENASSYASSDNGDDETGSTVSGSTDASSAETYKKKKYRAGDELNEKRELLYQMERLEAKGFKLPFKFNMQSDLDDMRTEYNRIVREKEIDASVRFQRKMLMAFITGTEYLNTRYDPFAIKLDGWSEQVHDTINDYDDIFEELHSKYKSSGKKMAPELRLFISLSGSAFMFHLTNRMFKEQPLPNIEEVLKSDPELMKRFQNAATKQYVMGNNGAPQMNNMNGMGNIMGGMMGGNQGGAGGILNMVSNLFGSLNEPSQYSQQAQYSQYPQQSNKPLDDINNIISSVHDNINIDNDNNIETLSVSDEEITSIIEDTADIKILRNSKSKKLPNTRTLNL